jgi:hypothetical protein
VSRASVALTCWLAGCGMVLACWVFCSRCLYRASVVSWPTLRVAMLANLPRHSSSAPCEGFTQHTHIALSWARDQYQHLLAGRMQARLVTTLVLPVRIATAVLCKSLPACMYIAFDSPCLCACHCDCLSCSWQVLFSAVISVIPVICAVQL